MMLATHRLKARGLRCSQRGSAVVETIIVVPVLFILVFLVLEVANIIRVYEKVSWIAEYSVREGSEAMDSDFRLDGLNTSKTVDNKMLALGLFESLDILSVVRNSFTEYCAAADNCQSDANWQGGPFSNPTDDFVEGDLVRVTVSGKYKPFLNVSARIFPDLTISKRFTRVISRPQAPVSSP